VVLASQSPRRRELLAAILAKFEIQPADIPEPLSSNAIADARQLALGKARAVFAANPDAWVVGCDTVVFDDRGSLGKPENENDAVAMLASLAGRTHRVVTGIALVGPETELLDHAISDIEMDRLSDERIRAYVATGRTMDKAGGYAIQDEEFRPVASFHGCYCNVVGLPLWRLKGLFQAAGVPATAPALPQCATCPDWPEGRPVRL
jgi:MAF protein